MRWQLEASLAGFGLMAYHVVISKSRLRFTDHFGGFRSNQVTPLITANCWAQLWVIVLTNHTWNLIYLWFVTDTSDTALYLLLCYCLWAFDNLYTFAFIYFIEVIKDPETFFGTFVFNWLYSSVVYFFPTRSSSCPTVEKNLQILQGLQTGEWMK